MQNRQHRSQRGIILLVVLTTLTFFSILLAAYLVFSNQSRAKSIAIASRNDNRPDVNALLNDSLMMLVRGTGDTTSPFFGEDLLSDYYGRRDATEVTTSATGISVGTSGLARFDIAETLAHPIDDVLSGRIITFRDDGDAHGFENHSFRVLRSIYDSTAATPHHYIIIEVEANLTPADVTAGATIWVNGMPRNAAGLGYDGTTNQITENTTLQPGFGGLPDLPLALQPNHLNHAITKEIGGDPQSDFDESYDAADFNNWFLSHRHPDGTIIPSFHRPSIINYLLNQPGAIASPNDLAVSMARGTFRPIPIHGDYTGGTGELNENFTGGNANYALRVPLQLSSAARIDQLVKVLIGATTPTDPYDVDNDADGVADSIWMDLDLPLITSADGKLLKPLIAPMIEDLSGRLNINAIGNSYTDVDTAGIISTSGNWAGTSRVYLDPANQRTLFRGIGWGPAEAAIPAVKSTGLVSNTLVTTTLGELLNDRYRIGTQAALTPDFPGVSGRDSLDLLRFGYRPPIHFASSGYGYSTDPFGRRAMGMGRSGSILAANESGVLVNEAVDTPYEFDPSGRLNGDAAFSVADLESILRLNEFDRDQLPSRLADWFSALAADDAVYANELARCITTLSKSDDSPASPVFGETPTAGFYELFQAISGVAYTQLQFNELLAPEIRLGRKLDVNRAIGNSIDDDGNGVIDEPLEVTRLDNDGADNNGDGRMDEMGETPELESFAVYNTTLGTIPNGFTDEAPNYTFDEPAPGAGVIPVSGRQLLARHLYVLMMALTRDLDNVATEFIFPSTQAMTPAEQALYKSRRLAQWAVNVVDYRDPDSIMTRFVFDPTPFDATGWDAVDTTLTPAADALTVWGVESPDLMFSESLALHDVRCRDTDFDNGIGTDRSDTTNPDPNSDQVRVPQGSLFLELYCPHPTVDTGNNDQQTKPGLPQEIYNTDGYLDLGSRAPALAGTVGGAPVWRIAISESNLNSPTAAPVALEAVYPDSASYEPQHPSNLGNFTDPVLDYERFIWFGNSRTVAGPVDLAASGFASDFAGVSDVTDVVADNAITDMTGKENGVFYASNASNGAEDRLLLPGQYLTLSPRISTHLGSRSDGAGQPLYPSRQRFEAAGTGLVHFRNSDGTTNPPSEVQTSPVFGSDDYHTEPANLVVESFLPLGWNPATFEQGVVGLSISEPLHSSYYPTIPTVQYEQSAGSGEEDDDGFGGDDYPLLDAYLDLFATSTTNSLDVPSDIAAGVIPASGDEPLLGTIPHFCSAYLQRLADPTLPYNEVTNPYRTVDWIPIDLTVFNGEGTPDDMGQAGQSYAHRSRQRNGDGSNKLFSYQTNDVDFGGGGTGIVGTSSTTELDFFHFTSGQRFLYSSLGFLNTQTYTEANFLTSPADLVARGHSNLDFVGFDTSIGSLGTTGSGVTGGQDRNLPQTAFASHPWLNRPYATPFELMMVPACSQGRLFAEFGYTPGDPDVYPPVAGGTDATVFRAPFPHLLNFFHSEFDQGTGAEFAKLFDYVHTMPRYRGEVTQIQPSRLTSTNAAEEAQLAEVRNLLLPPFGITYDNQRLGTVNLNSLAEFQTWAGLMQGHLNAAEFSSDADASQLSYLAFNQARRGYASPAGGSPVTGTAPFGYDVDHLDPNYPTQFPGVFKRGQGSFLAPVLEDADASALARRRPVNAGLLRGAGTLSANDPVGGTPTPLSLFVRSTAVAPTSAQHDRIRNPFMKYQTLMRMPNLVSENSQVFAIRMTLGFFEVDASNTNSLGAEYNESIGQAQRYKAMFIVDRSIPVGFVPGQDLNARDTVIFERFYQ